MKILCGIQRYYPVIGGSEALTKNLMDYLSIKHEVMIYTSTAYDIGAFWDTNAKKITDDCNLNYPVKRYDILTPTELEYIPTQRFFIASSFPGPFLPKMWKDIVINKLDCDLIFATSYPYDHILPMYVASKKWKIPIIIMPLIHQEFPELYLTSMRLSMLNNSDGIFVLSKSEKNYLVLHGIPENKISIIKPPLDLVKWENLDNSSFRNKYAISTKTKLVLFIGSKSFVKGVIHLMDAMKLVWEKGSDSLLILVGPSTREFEEYFKKLPHKFREKIINLGIVNEETKKTIIVSCDVLVVPSKSESFGLVYLEAWICQKPVIGCTINSSKELIENKKDGILVEFGNIIQLCNAIDYLINNKKIREQYGIAGHEKSLQYDSKIVLPQIEEKCLTVVKDFNRCVPG